MDLERLDKEYQRLKGAMVGGNAKVINAYKREFDRTFYQFMRQIEESPKIKRAYDVFAPYDL